MTTVLIFVREVGSLTADFALEFDLPEVPKPGAYISVYRGGQAGNRSEDMVVEKVWWQLKHPVGGAFGSTTPKMGAVEIIVECTQAIGPHSSEKWRDKLIAHRDQGVVVPEFMIASLSANARRR
jgi:hypothetical protein